MIKMQNVYFRNPNEVIKQVKCKIIRDSLGTVALVGRLKALRILLGHFNDDALDFCVIL